MSDIILNGVSINELRAMQVKIQPEAAKYVADGIKALKRMVKLVRVNSEPEDEAEAQKLAGEAIELANNVNLVAAISGVTYDVEGLAYRLADDFDLLEGKVDELYDVLEAMESQTEGWNSSNC